ncbi:DUF1631 family protein [Pelomonas sp. KK5]|uniref:DUF1631 family protein n=1 Tax=Pelomonas sp. KK5 TaxID=1855730 RepID=UPI00097CB965|nr:DUF1631 family protein [Pelomonas sp. KK5]
MLAAPSRTSLLDEALTQVPALSRHLVEAIHDELSSRPQYFAAMADWRRLRPRFAGDFEGALIPLLQAGRRGEDPLAQAPRGAGSLDDGLSLVDERQALQDVALAHVVQTIEQHNLTELHQLTNLFAALRGTAKARQNDNPLRPALFAQAMFQSLYGVELDAQQRYALMHAAATPMARSLHRLYADLCAQLKAADLSQMVASHAAHAQDADAHQRLSKARLAAPASAPATFDGLARRVQERNSRPGALTSLLDGRAGPDMLNRLYDQILADPRLLPPMKALLSRLQVAVVRLSRGDKNLLRHQDHPAWLLLDRVAAYGMGFDRGDDPRLQAFLGFMDEEAQLLIDSPMSSALLFEQVLKRVDRFLADQGQHDGGAHTLEVLEREQHRPQWLALVREQVEEQIDGAPLGPKLHDFLVQSWPEVIVHSMMEGGQDSPQAAAQMDLIDRLLASLQVPTGELARMRLRESLPGLIQDLENGCDSIKLFESQRKEPLQELMRLHARLLAGQPAIAVGPAPSAPAMPAAAPAAAASPHEQVRRLLDERKSELSEHWAHADVDRGQLPTVPVGLYESEFAAKAVKSWFDGLTVGSWFHMFVQSEWLTAQVAWVSESKQFFLFIGQDPDQRQSMTRGALEQLLANGLITALAEHGVVQRALDTLMSELADTPGDAG